MAGTRERVDRGGSKARPVCQVAGCHLLAVRERKTGAGPFVAYCSRHDRMERAGRVLELVALELRRR